MKNLAKTLQGGAAFVWGVAYLPGLQLALGVIQDADTALLLKNPSAAMVLHREAALRLKQFLNSGRKP